jgi:hypothetical protein
LIEKNSYAYYNEHEKKFTYTYDENDRLIEKNHFYYEMEEVDLHLKTTFKYDDAANVIEKVEYNISEDRYQKFLCKYDENNKLIKEICYNSEVLDCKNYYEYSKNYKKLKFKSYNKNDSLQNMSFEHYDDKGNLIEILSYDSDKKISGIEEYKYIYDKKGNWIRIEAYKDKTPYSINEREILYFD